MYKVDFEYEDDALKDLVVKIKAYLSLYSLSANEVDFEVKDQKFIIKPKQE